MNKLNLFSALTAPFPLIFLSNLFIELEVKLVTNPAKLSVDKGLAIFFNVFSLNYLTKNHKIHMIELF